LNVKESEVELDRLRIWDFYFTFPREARKISFPKDLSPLREFVFKEKEANRYEDLLDAKKVIERMKPYQMAALNCLSSYGFIDKDALSKKIIKRTEKEIPQELKSELSNLSIEKSNILKLVTGFWELPLHGLHGFKSRTGLIEYKYDAN
jgi:hypothetical protein